MSYGADDLEAVSRSYRLASMGLRVDGVAVDFARYGYMVDIIDDDHPHQVWLKGSQLGFTVGAVLRAIDRCRFQYTRGLAYYFPTERDVGDFSRSRFKRIIDENECLQGLVKETDSIGLRRVGSCYVYFRGANSSSAAKSIPADELVLDELDEMNPGNVEQIRHRLDAANRDEGARRTYLSTPTLPGFGIDSMFQDSDQHLWLIRCAGCNADTCLEETFPECLVWDANGIAQVLCGKCREPLDRFPEDPALARWVAKHPGKAVRGRWVSQLNSPTVPLDEILVDFEDAERTGMWQHFWNHRIGKAYAEYDDALSEDLILECCNDQVMRPNAEGPCAAGADVGKRDLHYVVGERRSDELGQIVTYGRCSSFDDLADISKRYHVEVGVIDEMAETRKVREFKESHREWWGCWYVTDKKGGYDWDHKKKLVNVGRTESLDASQHRLIRKKTRLPRPGALHHELLVPHLMNLGRRTVEEERHGQKTGRLKSLWVVRGATKNDHLRHSLNYYEIAFGRLGVASRIQRERNRHDRVTKPTKRRGGFQSA